MPGGPPSTTRTPFSESDDRDLVAFLAVHHPSKEGRMGNAVYKLLTEQPKKWPWGKRHTWMSWRQRYKNHEARFDHHIKAVQCKSKISRRPVPTGFDAMPKNGMEDLDNFGTDEEEEYQELRGKGATRADSDTEDDDEDPAKAQPGPANQAAAAPVQLIPKRKRLSDTNDRTSKRSRVAVGSSGGETQGEKPIDDPTYQSDEDSLNTPRKSQGVNTPKRLARPPPSGDPVEPTFKNPLAPRLRERIHRPRSPKHSPSSPFSTIDINESETDLPIVPRRARERAVPKIVEEFDLLVEKRGARKAGASKHLEPLSTGDDMDWEELRDLQHNTPEPGPSPLATSKLGSVEPHRSYPSSQPTRQLRPRQALPTAIDVAEKKMIEAREELSKFALRFRDRFPRSPLVSKSPDAKMSDDINTTHPFDDYTHPFDETEHPFDETTHPFDETPRPLEDPHTQTQEVHPSNQYSRPTSQEPHPFNQSTPQLPDSTRETRVGAVSPDKGQPESMATQELRKLSGNNPRTRHTTANAEVHPQTHERPIKTSERKLTFKARFSESSVKSETITPGYHLRSKSTANDDPFLSPTGLKLSSPHPPTMPDAEQGSPLASRTTSQSGLDAIIKSKQVQREAVRDRNRRVHGSERPDSPRPPGPVTTAATSNTLRKGNGVVEASVPADGEEGMDPIDESQTFDIECDLYDVMGTPVVDLSSRSPRIAPAYPQPSHTHHRASPLTGRSRDDDHEGERDKDARESSVYGERKAERVVQDDREHWRDSRRLSGATFGSPIAALSPCRNGCGQSCDRQESNTSNSFSSRTSARSPTSTALPTVGIMAGPLSLGFTPSELDAYLGIQVACEKIAKTHGFQSDSVFKMYQEVKDLRKTEETVIGMKQAAEKDATGRITKATEKSERKISERPGEDSPYKDRDGGQNRI